jgi:hypothetical protein
VDQIQKLAFHYVLEYPILIPFFLFGVYYLKNQTFRRIFNRALKKLITISFSSPIFAHDLFYQKDLFLVQIKRVRFTSKAKTSLFRILLEEKVKAVIEVSHTELKKHYKTLRNAHPSVVAAELFLIVDRIIETYEAEIKRRYISLYGEHTGMKLYEFIYLNNFKPYHDENVKGIERKINRLPLSLSKSFDDVIRTFLSKLQDATDDAVLDCEEIFSNGNGSIDAIINGKPHQ